MNVKHELCCVAEPSGVTIAVGKYCYLVNEDRQLASAPASVPGVWVVVKGPVLQLRTQFAFFLFVLSPCKTDNPCEWQGVA